MKKMKLQYDEDARYIYEDAHDMPSLKVEVIGRKKEVREARAKMMRSMVALNNLHDELVSVLEMAQEKSRDRKQLTNKDHTRLWDMLQKIKQI